MIDHGNIHVSYNEEAKCFDLNIDGNFIGPVEDALRFIYGAMVELQRDRIFPTPGLYIQTTQGSRL